MNSDTTAGAPTRTDPARHLVFLIPGLLGFDNFAAFSYFADRACAALRAGLEARLGVRIDVVPLPIPPLDSLAQRQAHLLRTLMSRAYEFSPERPPNVHLVGHSTGGVDTWLLTRSVPLAAPSWEDLDRRAPAFLAAVRSVISLASPHQGACIANDPAAGLLGARSLDDLLNWKSIKGIPAVAKLGLHILGASTHDPAAREFLAGAVISKLQAARYLQRVISGGALVEDLQPRSIGGLLGPGELRADVVRRSFVTVAHTPQPGVSGSGYPDELFRDVSLRASGHTTGCTEEGDRVEASVQRLRSAIERGEVPVIGHPRAQLPSRIHAGHNDGIVNSARQLFDPTQTDELAAIVIGDHYDVIGHYDRRVWTTDAAGNEQSVVVNAGLLHSGSAFRDDQFFALWGMIADVIAAAALARVRPATVAPSVTSAAAQVLPRAAATAARPLPEAQELHEPTAAIGR